VRALSQSEIPKAAKKVGNAALHRKLQDHIRTQPWINDSYINLTVSDGVVELWGFVVSTDQRNALRALVEETDGVSRVEDKLSIAGPLRGGL
jgi:osmotically-inducible protein OsmY